MIVPYPLVFVPAGYGVVCVGPCDDRKQDPPETVAGVRCTDCGARALDADALRHRGWRGSCAAERDGAAANDRGGRRG